MQLVGSFGANKRHCMLGVLVAACSQLRSLFCCQQCDRIAEPTCERNAVTYCIVDVCDPFLNSSQIVEERSRGLEIGGLEPFGKSVVNRREQLDRISGAALIVPQLRKASCGTQLPG